MQLVAINWHVYLLTKSAFALGMVGLVRFVPFVLCSLIGGVVADAFDRKRLMLGAQTVMMVGAALLALDTSFGIQNVWPIYVLTAISSAASAFDTPARHSLVPALVPIADFANAVSLNSVAFQIAIITGPLLAGLALGLAGPGVVYAVNACSFLAVIAALLAVRANCPISSESRRDVSFRAMGEGLRFVWRTPLIVQTTMTDFIATVTASVVVLLPIFAVEILRVGPSGLGVLVAAPAVGAIVTGLVMARYGTGRRPGVIMLISVAIYGAATLAFGVSRAFWISLMLLVISGAADTVSTVIRQTARQLITPDRLRGRMTSINMIFFIGGPRLGEFQAGVVAAALGAPLAVFLGGGACLLGVLAMSLKARNLLNLKTLPQQEPYEVAAIPDHQGTGHR
jgi:MFS family permease